jgi:nitrogen regulatory protein P-II 1
MKEIKAFIRTNMIDYVIDALEAMEHPPGITLSDVRGWGHVKGKKNPKLIQRVKLETVVPDDRVEKIISVIIQNGKTGQPGDGKIFISEIDAAIRIRTHERNNDAIC